MNGKWNDSLYAVKVEEGETNSNTQNEKILLWKRPAIQPHKWNWTKFNEELCGKL